MMRILVLCDDRWHPAQTVRQGLLGLESQEFAFDYIEDAADWSAAHMDTYPLVLLSKSNNRTAGDETPWMDDATQAAFAAFVRRGGGLLVIHSGSAGYADTTVLRPLLGGVFVSHPPQCPVTVTPLSDHPLSAGSAEFTLQDEHYQMTLDDPAADVFVTTLSQHGSQPGGWLRRDGLGRVCMLTPGHNLEVWQHPAFQALISNALHWCGSADRN
jgi:type 1 glutamine amidotransferase